MNDLKVLLNSYHSGANAWFALAEARGHFAAEGLKVELTAGSGAYRAPMIMVDKGFDLTFGDLSALIALSATSLAASAVYIVHHRSPSAIAVPVDGPIMTPDDLAGRRMITHASDVAYRSFPAYAQAAGIDPGQVQMVVSDAPMAAMLQAMLAGEGDGVFGYISSQKAVLRQIDPLLAERLRFLPFPQVVPDLYGSAIIAAWPALESKGQEIGAFLRALNAALIEAVAEPAAAIEAVIARNPALDPQVEDARWRGTILDEMSHPEIGAFGFGAPDPARLVRAIDRLAATLPLTQAPTAGQVFDGAFLPDLAPRLQLAAAIAQWRPQADA